jgi:hypothetical protein
MRVGDYLYVRGAGPGKTFKHEGFRRLQGIVGETYTRMLVVKEVEDPDSPLNVPDDFTFRGQGPVNAYEVDGYFGEHAYSLFGKLRKRMLTEGDADLLRGSTAFPLRATGRTILAAAARPRAAWTLWYRRMGRL